jgi:hypothetical protein
LEKIAALFFESPCAGRVGHSGNFFAGEVTCSTYGSPPEQFMSFSLSKDSISPGASFTLLFKALL